MSVLQGCLESYVLHTNLRTSHDATDSIKVYIPVLCQERLEFIV